MDYGMPYWRIYLHMYEVSQNFRDAILFALRNPELKCWSENVVNE